MSFYSPLDKKSIDTRNLSDYINHLIHQEIREYKPPAGSGKFLPNSSNEALNSQQNNRIYKGHGIHYNL